MTEIHEFAPAKLNLYLHITGRRADGYHDLDSLVAFSTIGDEIKLRPSKDFALTIIGPQAASLINENYDDNLIVRAMRSLAELVGRELDAKITLVKNLPVASGIGGGSSDAAAALRALARHWNLDKDDPRIFEAAFRHGQDVPVCVRIENNYMTATGVIAAPVLPRADIVLVNPNKALPTPSVYQEYRKGEDPFSPLARLKNTPKDLNELVAELKLRSNDLYLSACRLLIDIPEIMDELRATNECLLARMSGSGATCFALYPNAEVAKRAATKIRELNPTWWVESGVINV